jgi:hypothetical protein
MNLSLIGPAGLAFVERFAKFRCVDSEPLIRAVERYNRDFSAYGNEVYAQLETRVAHWANFLDQGWFQHRLDCPLRRASEFDVVLDLGFSAPYAFASSNLREQRTTRFVFADQEQSCQVFFDDLTKMEGWQETAKRSRLVLADFEDQRGRELVTEAVKEFSPQSLLIVASEVLEHLTDTKPVWRWLVDELGGTAARRTAIYLTLPIGRRIPSHMIEIKSSEDAASWVGRYLPQHRGFVITNPGKPQTPFLEAAYCAWAEIPSV